MKKFPILALASIFYPKINFNYRNSDQDIVQFMTKGFQSINNLDDDIAKESIQNRLKKQFPEINFEAGKDDLIKSLKEKYNEEISIEGC